MKATLLTIEHPYCVRGLSDVLNASGGVPVHDSLDAATDLLEAVVAGIRELMTISAVSNQATLVFFAAETALALVYASQAGAELASGGAA